MWSLAVEEQYYLLLPIVLRVLPRRLWLPLIVALCAVSLAAYLFLYPRSPGVAFYLLPTRAWEIGIGAAATFVPAFDRAVVARRWVAGAAAVTMVVLCFASLPTLPG